MKKSQNIVLCSSEQTSFLLDVQESLLIPIRPTSKTQTHGNVSSLQINTDTFKYIFDEYVGIQIGAVSRKV